MLSSDDPSYPHLKHPETIINVENAPSCSIISCLQFQAANFISNTF